jgi:hypothetical protein
MLVTTMVAMTTFLLTNPTIITVKGEVTSVTVSATDEETRTESVSTIEENNGVIRMVAVVEPFNATNKTIIWTVVDGTGSASVDRCGQLFAISNGTVIVTGTSQDNPEIFDTMDVIILNQLEPIDLLSAQHFTILGNTGVSSLGVAITGHVGTNTSNALTGFDPMVMDLSGEFSTSPQVDGRLYLPNYSAPTPNLLDNAIADSTTAYMQGSLLGPQDQTDPYSGVLGGQTLASGIYKWNTALSIMSSITLLGDASDVWVFQLAGGISVDPSVNIILAGEARPEHIFWLSATTVTIGANSHFQGIIIASTSIAVGAGVVVDGRLYAQTRVDLGAGSTISAP